MYAPDHALKICRLLKVFFPVVHGSTRLSRQGPDSGTPYRPMIFYANDAKKNVAQACIRPLNAARVCGGRIVTRNDLPKLAGLKERFS